MSDNVPERPSEAEKYFSAQTTVRGMDITCFYHPAHSRYLLVLGTYGTGTDVQKYYKTETEARNAFDLAVSIARAQRGPLLPIPNRINSLLEPKIKGTRAREAFFDGCAREKIPADITEEVLRFIDEENITDAIIFVDAQSEKGLSLDQKNKLKSFIYREGNMIIDGNRVPIQLPRFTNVTPSPPIDLTAILRSGVRPSEAKTFVAFMKYLGLNNYTNTSDVKRACQERDAKSLQWKAFMMMQRK